jgi:hypothetical protein
MDGVTWQVIGYEDAAGVPQVGQIVLIRTSDEGFARFLSAQLLMFEFARNNPEDKELLGYSAELRRGRSDGPLDTGSWAPEHHDDPVADIAPEHRITT